MVQVRASDGLAERGPGHFRGGLKSTPGPRQLRWESRVVHRAPTICSDAAEHNGKARTASQTRQIGRQRRARGRRPGPLAVGGGPKCTPGPATAVGKVWGVGGAPLHRAPTVCPDAAKHNGEARATSYVMLRDVVATFCLPVLKQENLRPSSEDAMFKGRQFDQSVILLCVRWYLAEQRKVVTC